MTLAQTSMGRIPLHKAAWVIASVHLGTLARSRRAWACAGLLLLPALIAWIVAGSYAKATPSGLTTMLGWNALLQVSVPLVSLLMGVAVVAEEVDDRTITYLFLRPIPRTALLYGRLVTSVLWLAVCAAVAVALLVAAASTADGSDAGITNGVRLPLLLAACSGVAVYTAVFAALGVWVKNAMIVGLGYTFAVEGFLSQLPGRNQLLTLQHHLRSLIAGTGDDAWQRIDGYGATTWEPLGSTVLTLASIVVVAVLLGAWRLQRRQYELTS
jgi:ABC-2 type transport system permease protein